MAQYRVLASEGRQRYIYTKTHKNIKEKKKPKRLNTQSAGPVRLLIFRLTSIFLLASLVAGRRTQCQLVQCSREFTPSDLSTGISKLLQPAQAEVVLGQLSMYLSS
jgi:hypothetical protein